MSEIWEVVGQYAFPIVMCIIMAWYVKYIQDNYRADIQDLTAKHKDEMDKIVTALNNNTLAIQKLTDYISEEENNV